MDELLLLGASVDVAVEVHHVVEIARALGQRPEFLGKCLDVIVGENLDPFLGYVRIGMEDFGGHRGQDDAFIGRQVELDPRKRARG
jgi:hypothetical protein